MLFHGSTRAGFLVRLVFPIVGMISLNKLLHKVERLREQLLNFLRRCVHGYSYSVQVQHMQHTFHKSFDVAVPLSGVVQVEVKLRVLFEFVKGSDQFVAVRYPKKPKVPGIHHSDFFSGYHGVGCRIHTFFSPLVLQVITQTEVFRKVPPTHFPVLRGT